MEILFKVAMLFVLSWIVAVVFAFAPLVILRGLLFIERLFKE